MLKTFPKISPRMTVSSTIGAVITVNVISNIGGMGLVLALIYHRTQKLEYTIAVHFINNALGVLFMLLL